jgi:hypothetical protein
MAKPDPYAGLVIRYDYLWDSEKKRGQLAGKYRACVVAFVPPAKEGSSPRAIVCGITHSEPEAGIEIKAKLRTHLGFDDKRQWIDATEVNEVEWDDPGIIPIPETGEWSYGDLPPAMAEQLVNILRARLQGKQLTWIDRPELEKKHPGG